MLFHKKAVWIYDCIETLISAINISLLIQIHILKMKSSSFIYPKELYALAIAQFEKKVII